MASMNPSPASMKRQRVTGEVPGGKKTKFEAPELPESVETNHRVVLNPADCDLDFNIEENGLKGFGLYENGFAYCWSGARANVGITRGKYCFSCTVISAQPVVMDDTPLDQQHVCRVGISRGDSKVGNLGETQNSFGFGGTGKFSNGGKFDSYGDRYEVGDTILCAVDLETKPMASISFTKNGKWLGIATCFNAGPSGLGVIDTPIKELQWGSALFPHILLKNVVVRMQFSYEDGLIPEEGYKPWASALSDGNAIIGPNFLNQSECELMMMVGLPASGKSTWAEKWVNDHPEKRYVLLGTNLALDQMKVPGLLRKHNYGERFDRLMDRATGIFNTLLARAAKTRRNFIIDQTNVYKNARKRKLKPFADYYKIAVVCFPTPEELKRRSEQRFREMGKEVPADAVNEMLANFVFPKSKDMPGTDEYFDQVIFIELNRMEAQRYLDEMKASLNTNNCSSVYSRESSIQSTQQPYMSTPVQHSHENSTDSYVHAPGQYSQRGLMQQYNNPSLQYQGGSWPNLSTNVPAFGNDPSAYFQPRDDFNHRRSYSGYDQSWRRENEFIMAAPPTGVSDPYQRNLSYGIGDNYHTYPPNSGSRDFLTGVPGTNDYQRGLVEPYAAFTTNSCERPYIPGGPHALTQSAPPPPYGALYGGANQGLPYGNPPSSAPNSGGFFLPHRGY